MNINPEIRNGYNISEEMKTLWAVELKLLKKLLDVCKKNDLKIWADSGTLLGAVRHHGFIPWDDDIDMVMPREDFDKLQNLAKTEFTSPFFWQSGYTDLFPNGMGKLRMDNTTAIERASLFKDYHQGIFIDIFPLDVMPNEQEDIETFNNEVLKLKSNLSIICEHHYSLTNWRYNFYLYKKVKKLKKRGFHKYFEDYDNYVKKYKDTDNGQVSLIAWYYHERNLRKRDWYNKTLYCSFEDILIPIPADYDLILTKAYGDYMTPIQAPSMHEGFICIRTDCSYKEFLPSLRRKYAKEVWLNRKNRFISYLKSIKLCSYLLSL